MLDKMEKYNRRMEIRKMAEVVGAMGVRLQGWATRGGKLAEVVNELHDIHRTLWDWCQEDERRDPDPRTTEQIDEAESQCYPWQDGLPG